MISSPSRAEGQGKRNTLQLWYSRAFCGTPVFFLECGSVTEPQENDMDRREMLIAAGSIAAAAITTQAFAAEDHSHHHHTGHPNQGLIESAAHCLMAGQACQQHCIELLGTGDKEMAPCAASVTEMLSA
jgi:hypothetical protein